MDLWICVSARKAAVGVDRIHYVKAESGKDEKFLTKAITERHVIDLNEIFGAGAFAKKRDVRYVEPQIVSIAFENTKCRLFLKGYNGANAQVVLNERFEPIEGVMEERKVFPRETGKPLQK